MTNEETIKGGAQLAGILLGGIITGITMNKVIGIITICGGTVYLLNQLFLLYKNIKNRKK